MGKTLKLSDNKARSLYKTGSTEFKQLLEENFGKDFFSQKITDRVKTYEDACSELGIEPINEELLKANGFTPDEIVYRKIKTITAALNEGWTPDWNNSDERKWYPYFYMYSSGFVFDVTYYRSSSPSAGHASRLCFKSDETARHAGKQFTELYKQFIL